MELDHAQDILAGLISTVVNAMTHSSTGSSRETLRSATFLVERHEETGVAGDVTARVRDRETSWRRLQERPRIEIASDRALRTIERDTAVPPAVVFEYLTSPIRRTRWEPTITEFIEEAPDGRRLARGAPGRRD